MEKESKMMKRSKTCVCWYCDKAFKTAGRFSKFCSRNCHSKHRSAKLKEVGISKFGCVYKYLQANSLGISGIDNHCLVSTQGEVKVSIVYKGV